MQEDSKKNTQVPPTTELSATERDESIARITAELLQACEPAPKTVKKEEDAPAAAQPKAAKPAKVQPKAVAPAKAQPKGVAPAAQPPAKKNAVLEKEISSATPDKSVAVSQAIAQNLLENDEGVHPFRQGDEKFKDFFTTPALEAPKVGQKSDVAQEKRTASAAEKPSMFARLQGLFARKPSLEEEEEEDEDVFFPEEVALDRAFPGRRAGASPAKPAQEPIDETVQFDLALTQGEDASMPAATAQKSVAPKGKVHFVQPEPVVTAPEPVKAAEKAAPVAKASPVVTMPTPQTQAPAEKAETPVEKVENPAEKAETPVEKVEKPVEKTTQPVQKVENPAEVVPAPQPETPTAQVTAEEDAVSTPPAEVVFEDLSEETAFLLEECAVETVRKETVFTLAMAKVQGWKESLQLQYEAVKQQRAAAKVAKQAAEDAEIDAEIDAMMKLHPDEVQEDEAQEAARDLLQEDAGALDTDADQTAAELQGAAGFFTEIAQDAAPAADTIVAADTEEVETSFFADIDQPDSAGQAAPTSVTPTAPDPSLASVQSAFALRGGQATVTDAALLEAFDAAPAVEEIATEKTTVEAPTVEATAVDELAVDEPAVEAPIAEEPVEQEPVATAATATVTASNGTLDVQIDVPDPVLPSGVCLFDQAADEAAAELQIGEITFVGAPAPAAHESDPFVQDVRAPEDVTQDWMPEEPEQQASAAKPPEEMPLLDDTLLADIAEGAEASANDAVPVTPFEDSPKAERVHEPLPEDPEGIQFGLSGMRVKLLVRTFTTAVFAAGLFLLGLVGQGVLPAVGPIDPTSAPVPFLLVNLLLLLAAAGVSYPVFIEGVQGLWRKPSPDTLPAIATIAALLQLLFCLTLVDSYDPASITLFSALAGISLFADALGSLVMALVIQANFNLASAGVPHYLAYRVQGKDTQRTLTRGLELDAPALLASRPVQQMEGFLEKSFSPRASDRRAQWAAYGLLGGAVLAYLIALLKGQGGLSAVSCFAAVLCIGAPFSVTLLAAVPSVFLQRAAAKVGAVVPGWQAIEALGDINLLAVESSDLFPPLCAQLHGIKTFQKERVDLAILYATSMLMQGGDTLQNLFAGMVDNKQELLYPVKDLVHRKGLGFVGWCENYRVILGTRALMQAEGVPLPALDYENRYSKDGKRQVLYLSVSGQLYAMFIIGYRGEKSIARALRTLRRAHIRLLVNCTDPTLTAQRIEEIYRLPAGFITLLSEDQATVLQGATGYRPRAEGCLLHLGNFASLVGGLRAASGAAQAEQAASAIQLVWAAFSILLCLFLCITDGLMQVALVAILLYQLTWSVLNLGIVFTKKFE